MNTYYECKYSAKANVINTAWGLNEWCMTSDIFEYDVTDFYRRCDYITSWAQAEYACICYTIQKTIALYDIDSDDLLGWLENAKRDIMESSTRFGCNVLLSCNLEDGTSEIEETYYEIDFILTLYQQYEELGLSEDEIEALIANDIGVGQDSVNVTQEDDGTYLVEIAFDYKDSAIEINDELGENGVDIGEADKISIEDIKNSKVVDPVEYLKDNDFAWRYGVIFACVFSSFFIIFVV